MQDIDNNLSGFLKSACQMIFRFFAIFNIIKVKALIREANKEVVPMRVRQFTVSH